MPVCANCWRRLTEVVEAMELTAMSVVQKVVITAVAAVCVGESRRKTELTDGVDGYD